MRKEIQYYLDQNPELKYFIRMHPDWYRRLGRFPGDVSHLKQEADEYYGRTLNKKIERFSEQLNLISMFMEMANTMGNQNSEDNKEVSEETQG
ncbi:YlbE-like family protein [Scopulibacillus cellulosilyticus]|uniref:YlbE-like family protein n=1 Tax=Scopulibacillus cellulosilyticus TaxID=2665665 RepID=A0ABW2PSQ8_9BACL